MANSQFDGLNKADMALISDWFESDVYRVFTKVAKMRRDAVAGQLLTTYNERQVPHLQGQADGVKKLHEFFKAVNKEFRKEPDTK